MNIFNKFSIKLIEAYQKTRPFGTQPRCRHVPTCSQYGLECFKKFNFFKASFLTTKRIICCNPLNKKIYDPVPLTKTEKEQIKEQNQNNN